MEKQNDVLRVSHVTEVKKLANAIIMALQNKSQCEVMAIGAGAVNQAVKGIASANGLASTTGGVLTFTPFFQVIDIGEGQERTAIVFLVTKQSISDLK